MEEGALASGLARPRPCSGPSQHLPGHQALKLSRVNITTQVTAPLLQALELISQATETEPRTVSTHTVLRTAEQLTEVLGPGLACP